MRDGPIGPNVRYFMTGRRAFSVYTVQSLKFNTSPSSQSKMGEISGTLGTSSQSTTIQSIYDRGISFFEFLPKSSILVTDPVIFLPSRGPGTGFYGYALLLLLVSTVLLAFSSVSAQEFESEAEADKGLSNGSGKSLSRRSKIFLDHPLRNNVAGDKSDPDLLGLTEIPESSGLGIFDAFFASLSMIIVSEIGDETFIIAALMAMRHPKSIVLSGALSALYVMTVLSTGLGRIVPNLISRKHTNSAATVLYAFFGLRLLYIAWRSEPKSSQKKEMEEVEEKLEGGQGKTTLRRFFSRFCTPIFLESFILTFLAEWGDRSQIATIALATHKNALGVAVGASLGHTVCTSIAVVGGSMLASKISQRTVAAMGGLLFLCFSLSSYFYPPL
ncbi:hypothetical protein NE237_016197 [Protea cynaroides]|uniref:GDT1 family protein n=1 Tax=Protea cynaroides TaxID=273540 RepID=A0A9Q0KFQ8_9MAGN|nr:hypothetical protein NE237_016197 [Protea cynaroides]